MEVVAEGCRCRWLIALSNYLQSPRGVISSYLMAAAERPWSMPVVLMTMVALIR